MGNLVATSTEDKWEHDQLLRNTVCTFCNREYLNNWYSCNRRSAMVNLHPGLLSTERQHYYLIKIVAKYIVSEYPYGKIPYAGHPGAKTTKHIFNIPHVTIPKPQQQHAYITHGEL